MVRVTVACLLCDYFEVKVQATYLPYSEGVMVKSQQKAVVKLLNACGLRERILHMVM